MKHAVCGICGKRLTYKDKLLGVWVSPMGLMSVECCGVVWVPTIPSYVLFYGLLYISIVFAFYYNIPAYFGIAGAWVLALSFLTPLFMRLKPKRIYGISDRFLKRVFSKTRWDASILFLYFISWSVIIYTRLYYEERSMDLIVLYSLAALAAVTLIVLVIAVIRVLLENKKASRNQVG